MRSSRDHIVALLRDAEIHGIRNSATFASKFRLSRLKNNELRFVKVWQRSSKSPIFLLEEHIYVVEEKTCYPICKINEKCNKQKGFRLEEDDVGGYFSGREKSSASYELTYLTDPSLTHESSCFLSLRGNTLIRHSYTSGKLLNKIFLGNINYKTVQADVQQNTILIQSVPFLKSNVTRSTASIHAIIIISIIPFKFLHRFELSSEVVGHGVKSIKFMNGLMLLSTSNWTRIYNMAEVIETGSQLCNCDFGEDCSLVHGSVGLHPAGIPVNMVVESLPSPIFEVSNDPRRGVSFGSVPICCLFTSQNKKETPSFRLTRMKDGQELGKIELATVVDNCSFHPNRPDILLYESNHSISLHKFSASSSHPELKEVLCIKSDELQCPAQRVRSRSLQRPERRTAFKGNFVIHAITMFETLYDKSLDLFLVRAISSHEIMQSSIFFYTASEGKLIREFVLPGSVKKQGLFKFALSRDALSVVQQIGNTYQLSVFRLSTEKTVDPLPSFKDSDDADSDEDFSE